MDDMDNIDTIGNYKLIDMFDQLDEALLDDLNLGKDLGQHKKRIRRLFQNGHVRIATIIAGVGLLITGVMLILIRIKKICKK